MRLLHSTSLELEERVDNDIPNYAILSHRWLGDAKQEITFQDMKVGDAKHKAGYSKIEQCAKQAASDGLEYFWVDTCCIDKSSSAELSEAINSMYRWYKNAKICYVYMFDVSVDDPPHPDYPTVSTFEKSDWFSRGWTLQELIAPLKMVFYSKEWRQIGTKDNLTKYLERITGIDAQALEGVDPGIFSIASRMSWAAKRKTTRTEDMAYSLLGIFDVNMPLLYGEGEKSFIRLQEEIMKTSDDQSLFAWKVLDSACESYTGLLARSPACFVDSGNFFSFGLWSENELFSMTSKGLRAKFYLIPDEREKGLYYARLECQVGEQRSSKPAICLQLVSILAYGSQYIRIRAGTVYILELNNFHRSEYRTVYVRQDTIRLLQPSRLLGEMVLPSGTDLFLIRGTTDIHFSEVIPSGQWSPHNGLFCLPPSQTGGILVRHNAGKRGSKEISLLFGVNKGQPVCRLDDPEMVHLQPFSHNVSGFGVFSQCILWRASYNNSKSFATARISQSHVHSRSLFIITLYLITVE